jgi:hypothetical protein
MAARPAGSLDSVAAMYLAMDQVPLAEVSRRWKPTKVSTTLRE